jgi:PAS domain S-box-containing protein
LLYNVSRELASALDLRTALQRILIQSLKYVGGERGSLVVMDDNGKPIDAAIVYGRRIHDHTTQQLRDTIERGLAGWVVRNRQPAWIPDTSRDERWLRRPDDALDQSGAKAALCVPLLARERLVGVLTLVHPEPGAYNKDHFNLMQSIGDQAGITVLNARLYAESQRQARVMTALATSAATINASLQQEEVLKRILNETIQALQVETVTLALVEASGDLAFLAATGENSEGIVGKRIPAGKGIVGWVVREGQGVIVPAVQEDKRYLPDIEQVGGLEARALACAPIYAQGHVIGVLQAVNPTSGVFDPDAVLVLAGIGNLAGSAIQHAQLFERLQAAHKHYRELFDDSVDPILVTGLDGQIHESNRQAAVLSGYTSRQLQGMKIDDLHEATRGNKEVSLEKLKSGRTISYEGDLKSKAGHLIPIQVYVRLAVFEEEESLQWILRDITERKDLDRLREDLTSMIYHDLRSPLSNIVSSLEILGGMISEDEATRSILNVAVHSTGRIQRLVNSLLDIYRLESGQPIEALTVVTPEELIKNAVSDVSPSSEGRRQTIQTKIEEKLPELRVDADMLRRVIINLLENAIKFSKTEAEIETGASKNGDSVQFWVKDNGPGVPQSEQKRIFEKFARIKTKVERRPSGLGIGLAFCRMAVNAHGGKIWVESEAGKGSKFIFTVPLKDTKK